MLLDEEATVVTPQIEAEVINGNGMPTPHSYGTPHKLVGNTFFGPDFNIDSFRGERSMYILILTIQMMMLRCLNLMKIFDLSLKSTICRQTSFCRGVKKFTSCSQTYRISQKSVKPFWRDFVTDTMAREFIN